MPLYGYREMLDNRVATLVVAADSVEAYVEWCDVVRGQVENSNFEELYTSALLDAMTNPSYKGYKHPVIAAYHTDFNQQDKFWVEWEIVEVKSMTGRDRQADMLFAKKEQIRLETETPEEAAMTIEEKFGLDKHDPWDRRSEAEKAEDLEMKKKIEAMRKSGELSGDGSFSGADAQRSSRDRAEPTKIPGAFSRTDAIDALQSFAPEDEWDSIAAHTNDELADALRAAGVPDVKGVYDDDAVPHKAARDSSINVTSIKGDTDSSGVFNIEDIVAHKSGGEIDTDALEASQAAHAETVEAAKAGRKAFSPEDFAAVLRGDGSADAAVNVAGDDRTTRKASVERPSLSAHAEEERKKFQERQDREMKLRRIQAEKEADIKARGERDRGIFRGGDLFSDDEPVVWDDLPENLRTEMEAAGLKRDTILVKNYPFNSELGGRAILPYDSKVGTDGIIFAGGVNIDVEGTMSMGDPAVAVVSKKDSSADGWGIYARKRLVAVEGSEPEAKVDVWLVRIR